MPFEKMVDIRGDMATFVVDTIMPLVSHLPHIPCSTKKKDKKSLSSLPPKYLCTQALIPLTMCRYTISKLSQVPLLSWVVPFEKMVDIHIHLGYVMCGFVFGATIFFFGFFGQARKIFFDSSPLSRIA